MDEQYYRIPRRVLAIALLMAFGMWLPLTVVPVVTDIIDQQLSISHTLTALLFSSPVAILAITAIPGGFLADKIGIKKAVGIGVVILALGSALRGLSSNFPSLLLFTLIYGLGLGLSFPNLPKLAQHCTLRERSNITVGMFTAAILISGALSLAIIRPVIYPITHSYQGVFFISSIPVILVALLWWIFIHDPPCESAGIQAVNFGLASFRQIVNNPTASCGALGVKEHTPTELRTRSLSSPQQAEGYSAKIFIKKFELWLVSALFFMHNVVLYTILGSMLSFLVNIGVKASVAGLITSIIFLVGTLSVLSLTRLSTKLGRRKPFLWGPSILLIVVSLGPLIINLQTSWILMSLIGLAAATRFTMILTLPVEMVSPENSGSASGLVMSVGYLGALAGPIIGGIILDTTHRYQWMYEVEGRASLRIIKP